MYRSRLLLRLQKKNASTATNKINVAVLALEKLKRIRVITINILRLYRFLSIEILDFAKNKKTKINRANIPT
jgi:hypothetical protein